MGFLNEVGDSMKKAGNKIKEGAASIDDKIDASKLESEIKTQEREIDSIATDIGKKVIESIDKDGSFDISSIKDLLDKVKEIKGVIGELTGKLDALKK